MSPRVAPVTGAAHGIGAATTLKLSEQGRAVLAGPDNSGMTGAVVPVDGGLAL